MQFWKLTENKKLLQTLKSTPNTLQFKNWMFFRPVSLKRVKEKLQFLKLQSVKSLMDKLLLVKLQFKNPHLINSPFDNSFSE